MSKENNPDEEQGLPPGSVLRWTAMGRYQFAALHCDNGFWYITGGNGTYGTSMKSSSELLDLLEDEENAITDIEAATGWEAL